MEPLRELFLKLGLDWNGSSFATAQVAVDGLEWGARKLVEAFEAVGRVVVQSVTATASYGDNLDEARAKTGMATTALQEWRYAAGLSGVEAGQLDSAIAFLSSKMADASKGGEDSSAAFAKLGVSLRGANGEFKSTDQIMSEVAAKLGEMPDDFRRVAMARELFGRSGADLLPTFLSDLEAAKKEAHELGIVLGEDSVAAAARFKDNLDRLARTWESFSRDVGSVLIEVLGPLLDQLVAWVKVNRDVIRTRLQTFARVLAGAVTGLSKMLTGLNKALEIFTAGLKTAAILIGSYVLAKFVLLNALLLEQAVAWALNTAAAVAYGTVSLAAALKTAAAWLVAAAPVLLVAGALALAALAAEDVYTFLKGGDSVIGELGPKWTKFLDGLLEIGDSDPWWLKALKAGLQVITDMQGAFDAFIKSPAWALMKVALPGMGTAAAFLGGGDAQAEKDAEGFQRAKTMRAIYGSDPNAGASFASGAFGNGSTLARSAQASPSAGAARQTVVAPRFNAPISITQQPGQSSQEVASEVRGQLDTWWDEKMREANSSAPGSD